MGPFRVFILKSVAITPVITAAEELQDFFTVVSQAGSLQKLAGRVTDHYDFGFGAIKMLLNTLPTAPNEAPPPLNWDLVMWIGSQLLQMTNLGWTDHFAAVFVDPTANVQTFVTLQVVSAGVATIGYVNPETGQRIIPAIHYLKGSKQLCQMAV